MCALHKLGLVDYICLCILILIHNNHVRVRERRGLGFGLGCLGVCEKYFGERIRIWFWLSVLAEKHLNEFEKRMGILFTILRIWFERGLQFGLRGGLQFGLREDYNLV